MIKEAYYFSHDYNARNDKKLMKLKLKHKMRGIGIYWCLVEMLYEEGGKLSLSDMEVLGNEFREKKNLIEDVIKSFELFENDGEYFWSKSVNGRLSKRFEKSLKASESAQLRWRNANGMRSHSEGNAIKERKVKESKGEESKVKLNGLANANPAIAQNRIVNFNGQGKELKKEFELLIIPEDRKAAWVAIKSWIVEKQPQFIEPYTVAWNVYASFYGFPSLTKVNATRRKKFETRIKEDGFQFFEILDKAKRSDFLKSGNWFNFDWIIENDRNYLKVLEDNYK